MSAAKTVRLACSLSVFVSVTRAIPDFLTKKIDSNNIPIVGGAALPCRHPIGAFPSGGELHPNPPRKERGSAAHYRTTEPAASFQEDAQGNRACSPRLPLHTFGCNCCHNPHPFGTHLMQVIPRMCSSCKDATNRYEEVPTASAQTRQAEPAQTAAPVQTTSVMIEKAKATRLKHHIFEATKVGGALCGRLAVRVQH
eukprot:2016186-Amphidinium_carterae.3